MMGIDSHSNQGNKMKIIYKYEVMSNGAAQSLPMSLQECWEYLVRNYGSMTIKALHEAGITIS